MAGDIMNTFSIIVAGAAAVLLLMIVWLIVIITKTLRDWAADREREKYYADQWRKIQLAKRQAGK